MLRNLRIKPPIFNGKKGQNIKQFYSKLEKYLEAQGIDEDHKIEATGLCFEDDALEHFDSFNRANAGATYEEIKEAMTNRYDQDKIAIVIRSRISKRVLEKGESVSDYFNGLRREANKINMPDDAFLFSFIQGLPKEFMRQIIVQNPETPDEALTIAKTLEQIDEMHKPEKSKSGLELLRKELAKETKVSAVQHLGTGIQISELKETLAEITKSIQNLSFTMTANTVVDQQQLGQQNIPPVHDDQNNNRQRYNTTDDNHDNQNIDNNSSRYRNNGDYNDDINYNGGDNRNNFGEQYVNLAVNTGYNFQNFHKTNSNYNYRDNRNKFSGQRQYIGPSKTPNPPSKTNTRERYEAIELVRKMTGGPIISKSDNIPGSRTPNPPRKRYQGVHNYRNFWKNGNFPQDQHSEPQRAGYCQPDGTRYSPQEHNSAHNNRTNNDQFKNTAEKAGDRRNGDFTADRNHTRVSTTRAQNESKTMTRAKVAKLIMLEPFQEAEVEVYPGSDILAKELVFTSDEKTQNIGLSAKNQIVPGFRSTMKIHVINRSGKKVRLFPNRCIGSFRIQGNAQTNVIVSNEENRLTHNVQEHEGLEDEVNQLRQFLHERRNVFASKMSKMGRAKSSKHEIRLATKKPVRARFYGLDKAKEKKNSFYASRFRQFLDLFEMF